MRVRGRYLQVVVAMCGLAAATVGLVTNVAGVFFSPMAAEFGVGRGAASTTLMISNICVALGGLATRRLTRLMPLRVLLVSGAAIIAASAALTAAAPSLVLAYVLAATRGLASGVVGFVLVTSVLNRWFRERLGLVTSIAMGSSGLAGAVFAPLVTSVVTSTGWRAGYVLVAVLSVVLCLPAILLVPSLDPADAGLVPFGGAPAPKGTDAGHAEDSVQIDRPLAAAVVAYAALSAAVSAMPQHFPALALEAGLTAGVGAAMVAACMVANTAGKVAMGVLVDRIGAKGSIFAYSTIVASSIVALFLVRAPWAYVAAAFLFGLCYARATVGLTMLTREVFGQRGFAVVYPVAALGCSFSNAVFSSAVGFGYDLTGGYAVSLAALLAFLGVSCALVAGAYRRAQSKGVSRASQGTRRCARTALATLSVIPQEAR